MSLPPPGEALTLRRVYPVPPDRVWAAWLDPDALRVWFGQSAAPSWQAQLDARVGGRFRIVMEHPDGTPYVATGVYRDVQPARRLSFTWLWQSGPGAGEALISVDFTAVPEGTEMHFRLDPVTDPREREAWRADFRRLGKLLQEG